MATIKEDYVPFEIAKLLKEKGFDVKCDKCYAYFADDDIRFLNLKYPKSAHLLSENRYPCITLQMAMKWIGEMHNIHIVPMIENNGNYIGYLYDTKGNNVQGWDRILSKTSYEEACEEAIKYCLENLI